MLNNRKFLKIGSYVGLLSIISSNVAMAIPPKVGELYIHARKELRMVGAPPLHPVVEDINQVSYEDFDVTSGGPQFLKRLGDFVWKSEKRKVRERHLDTNIPYIGVKV